MYKNNDPKDDKIKANNKWRTVHALLNPCTENDFILLKQLKLKLKQTKFTFHTY